MTDLLRCPVCGQTLANAGSALRCSAGHSFDVAKEGYVNLLTGGRRSGDDRGDSREMARSRHRFLSADPYGILADGVGDVMASVCPDGGTVLDICCGEGYYTDRLARRFPGNTYLGFDLSREMVRLASKRGCGASFFVANISAIPLADASVDFALHLFAPFHAQEFARVLRPGGTLVTAIPGRDHLLGLKEILYDRVRLNDEIAPDPGELRVTDRIRIRGELTLTEPEDILALLQMTPYYFRTPAEGVARLTNCGRLTTPIEFLLLRCEK